MNDPYVTDTQDASPQSIPQSAVMDPYVTSSPQSADSSAGDQYNDPYSITAPQDVASALQQTGSQDDNGECQKFVEQMAYGHSGIFPSAIDAWDSFTKAGQTRSDIQNMRPGSIIYFSPNQSNQGYGHTGIYIGKNQFISATDNGVKPYDLNKWQQMTGQQILGYVKP